MWFITGLVLIYHSFPDVSQSQKYEKMDVLPDSLLDINTVFAQLPESDINIKSLSLRCFQGQPLFTVETKDSTYTICNDTTQSVNPVTRETIESIANKWVEAPIVKIDTLNERDIWIMYSRYASEMPIYKFYFDDEDKHQLYIASRSGEVQQFTNREQRFWAWVGSIPHKLYIPALRKNADNWVLALTFGGIIALIAALSGMYVGIYAIRKQYVTKKIIKSPYKKSCYKWHHISGLIFGVFLITFAFSGAMALQRIPQWIIKTHGDYRITGSQVRGKRLPMPSYLLDYRTLKAKYPDIKTVEWSYFQDTPIYNIVTGDEEVCIDASSAVVKELNLPREQIEKAVRNIHGKDESFSVSIIDSYEEYYLSREKDLPLPVYKIEVNNVDKSCYYIDPKTGDFKYLNQSRKAKKWVFSGLHYLNIKCLIERPVLWTIAIWILCLGGVCVSLSGVWLGIKYIIRKLKY
nr:PepSY domain-containing protein [uncultured Macellibacteroides sp.]